MKLLLLADHQVGSEIAHFLLANYLQDLALIVTTGENDIFREANALGVPARVFETDEQIAGHLADASIDLGVLAWWPHIIRQPLLDLPNFRFYQHTPQSAASQSRQAL